METPFRSVAIVQALLAAALMAAILSRIALAPETAVPDGPAAPFVTAILFLAVAWGAAAFWNTRALLRGRGRRLSLGLWAVVALLVPIGTLVALFPLWVLWRNPEPVTPAAKA